MNDTLQPPADPDEKAGESARAGPARNDGGRFFQRADWLSFGLTTGAALAIYLFTLAPEVTLERSGIFSTGAFYAAVPHPPGYPLWTLYAWFFTVALPFSNIAWRVGVSSAVAGALTVGVLALMVSRSGTMILEGIAIFKRLPSKEESGLRVVSGFVAGMAFGFSDPFWYQAVVAEVWPLSMLLLSLVLCLLLRWFHAPNQRRYVVAACLVYGLTLTNSQALALAAPGLATLVTLGNPALGRDGLAAMTLLLGASLIAHLFGVFPWILAEVAQIDLLGPGYILGGIITLVISVGLAIKTGKLFTEWKTVIASGSALVLGLVLYFYLPLTSMTNPPMNWGYPRTVVGFVHDLTRGQFERIHPTDSAVRFVGQMGDYGETVARGFGLIYLAPALAPFGFLRRMRSQHRRWMLGTLAVYFCLSLLLVYFLNPPPDGHSSGLNGAFFSASYLLLALWTGYGLMVLGTVLARPFSKLVA